MKKPKFTESVCACAVCVGFCQKHPCLGTPEEAEKLLDAGFADRMMLDCWYYPSMSHPEKTENVYRVQPAGKGNEGKQAGFWAPFKEWPCTMLTEEGKCLLHDPGLKPLEGRVASHEKIETGHDEVEKLGAWLEAQWDTPRGRRVVERWKKEVKFDD